METPHVEMAKRIAAIAVSRRVSGNRAIEDLLEGAIAAYEQRRTAFLDLADRFQKSTDPTETERLRGPRPNDLRHLTLKIPQHHSWWQSRCMMTDWSRGIGDTSCPGFKVFLQSS